MRQRLREANLGKKHTEDSKNKMSEAVKKSWDARREKGLGSPTQETRDKIGAGNRGKVTSEEAKRKISEGNRGKIVSEETRQRMSEAQKGKPLTEEAKQKLREINLNRDPSYYQRGWETRRKNGNDTYVNMQTYSEEYRSRRSEEKKALYASEQGEEVKKKISKTLTGREIPEEVLQRHREEGVAYKIWEARRKNGTDKMTAEQVEKMTQATIARLKAGTQYKRYEVAGTGLSVRSTWELSVCQMLDLLGVPYEYEKYAFQLSNGKYYVPDFYIPELDEFWEIKGHLGRVKVEMFRQEYPEITVRILGENWFSKQWVPLVKWNSRKRLNNPPAQVGWSEVVASVVEGTT